ncbi:hypothetical protein Leryth_009160 [Lithospermum erythrorhizon]|nr:hypothetical protein Leryth_009160 [Lithospermum erythrorhizon]
MSTCILRWFIISTIVFNMEEVNLLIPQINLQTEKWIAQVTVIEDMPTLTGSKSESISVTWFLIVREMKCWQLLFQVPSLQSATH